MTAFFPELQPRVRAYNMLPPRRKRDQKRMLTWGRQNTTFPYRKKNVPTLYCIFTLHLCTFPLDFDEWIREKKREKIVMTFPLEFFKKSIRYNQKARRENAIQNGDVDLSVFSGGQSGPCR
jgi:hypothetical protein